MTATRLLDTINSLEILTESVPDELRNNDTLRKRLFDVSQKLVAEIETPAETLQRLLYLPCEMMGAKIGSDLNLFSALSTSDQPLSTADLSGICGAEVEMLSRLLKYMNSVGLVKETDEGWWHASNTSRNLSSRHAAAGINHQHDSVMPAYQALPGWLKKRGCTTPITKSDTPFAQGHGVSPDTSFFAWLQDNPYNSNEFNLFMGVHRTGTNTWLDSTQIRTHIMEAYEARGNEHGVMFVDIGGGIGQQCKALRERLPDLEGRVILQDLQRVIDAVDPRDDIETMCIDFFEDQPVQDAAVYYMRSILRDWPDAQSKEILKHIRNAMGSHSLLLIDETVLLDRGAHKNSTQIDLTMLSMLNGETRTEKRWRGLLETSGFKVRDIVMYQEGGSEGAIIAEKIDSGI